jgi:hypothetical protein
VQGASKENLYQKRNQDNNTSHTAAANHLTQSSTHLPTEPTQDGAFKKDTTPMAPPPPQQN